MPGRVLVMVVTVAKPSLSIKVGKTVEIVELEQELEQQSTFLERIQATPRSNAFDLSSEVLCVFFKFVFNVIVLFFTDRKTSCKVPALKLAECVTSGGKFGQKETKNWFSEVICYSIFCVLQVIKSYLYTFITL